MVRRSLEEVLRRAEGAVVQDSYVELGPCVLRRLQRQRRFRRAGITVCAALALSSVVFWNLKSVDLTSALAVRGEQQMQVPDGTGTVDVEQVLREAERTASMVQEKLHEQAQLARIEALERELALLEAHDPMEPGVHSAAAISVAEADDQLASGKRAEAESIYRQVAELFPRTPSARVAEERLAQASLNPN